MKIQNNTPIINNIHNQSRLKKSEVCDAPSLVQAEQSLASTSQIPFTGMNKLVPKKVDIEGETRKLLKQIGEILEFDTSDFSIEEYIRASVKCMLDKFRNIEARKEVLLNKLLELEADMTMPMKRKSDLVQQYRREFKAIQKMESEPPKPPQPKKSIVGDKMDFQLLNKLKSAILKGDFNLLKVYKDYYKGLTEIEDIEALKKAYPKIKVPPYPENVVAKKVVDTLTRDFFEELDRLAASKDPEAVFNHSDALIRKFCLSLEDKYNVAPESAYRKLSEAIHGAILDKYVYVRDHEAFSSIPITRKIKEPQITPVDISMLRVDYDEFVLDVLKRQYLGSEKLNDIVYEGYGVRIPVRSLSSTEYKMEKASERIRHFLTTGEKIRTAQRDYDRFDVQDLQKRLEYFANGKAGSDEELFTKIIDFSSCKFEPEDVQSLRQFLRKLDQFEDGDLSLDKLKGLLKDEDIRPHGTDRLDEIERQKLAESMKLQQRRLFELTTKQDEFDNAMNLLYENDMPSLAASCLKYRPLSLESKDTGKSQYLVDVISDIVSSAKGQPINKAKLEATITRWDTFNFYKEHKADTQIYQRAVEFARGADGSVDIDRAGQYIINSELVESYPQSMSFANNPEVLQKIMDRVPVKEDAIEYLFKFDTYTVLPDVEKTRLSVIETLFDTSNHVEKQLLKHVVEGDYAKSETKVLTKLNDKGDEFVESTFAPDAKQQIIDKYKYPVCMDYLEAFEDALTSVAPSWGASGIKITGSNNKALEYRMEVKLKGHDDRLFSSKNNYVFDIFSARGLH